MDEEDDEQRVDGSNKEDQIEDVGRGLSQHLLAFFLYPSRSEMKYRVDLLENQASTKIRKRFIQKKKKKENILTKLTACF